VWGIAIVHDLEFAQYLLSDCGLSVDEDHLHGKFVSDMEFFDSTGKTHFLGHDSLGGNMLDF
jgi:hypothetical protein